MNAQHTDLAEGRWHEMPFMLQMANTASEVERTVNWREKGNTHFSKKAAERAIELMDLTLSDPKNRTRLKEIARARELFTDFVWGDNEYRSSGASWRSYFSKFTFAARKND